MSIQFHPRVAELIASRICHDLVSPVGAISNGVELLQDMGGEAGGEALTLIATSAQQAAIRLKCFRLAYGAAGTDKNVGLRDIRDAFLPWLSAGHVQAEFAEGLDLKFSMPPQGFFKSLLHVLILAEECSRGEGKISVTALADGANGLCITAAGKNVAFREGVEAALKGETAPDQLDPRSVHAYVTGRSAAHFGFTLAHQAQPGQLELKISF
jgi:histidine phosphotransferase ChpT